MTKSERISPMTAARQKYYSRRGVTVKCEHQAHEGERVIKVGEEYVMKRKAGRKTIRYFCAKCWRLMFH